MSLFNLTMPLKEKEISQHPWDRTIKDIHSHKIKYAHNSIRNRRYPEKKEKLPNKDRLKITIIGIRTTKEFIYCINLIKGLHKYRWKQFDSPTIRGVTTVEWPAIWNDLKIQYGSLVYCLKSQVAVLVNDKFLGGDKELKELIEAKYFYHLILDYVRQSVTQFANFIKSSQRPCTYMHISINDKHIGTLIFTLYADVVPFTCENFLRLCKEKKGGYSGTPVHRIVQDGWIQCGGFGLKSTDLDCENFIIPHDRRGVLAMANDGRHVDCSTQFFVLLQPAPWMEHKYVAFGQLIDGEATLKIIQNVPTRYESPKEKIIIDQAGILNMDCHDIMINKNAHEYIQGHIENLYTLGEWLYELLMEKVFMEIESRLLECLDIQLCKQLTEDISEVHATQRISDKNLQKSEIHTSDVKNKSRTNIKSKSKLDTQSRKSINLDEENYDFDVENYEDFEYEPEECAYQHVSLGTPSVVVKPEMPFYLPLTDVLYPGEVDSTYDLKKLLKGDYCLESDLEVKDTVDTRKKRNTTPFPSERFPVDEDEYTMEPEEDIDSDEEREIQNYLETNVDRISFAGTVIRGIAARISKFNIFDNITKSTSIDHHKSPDTKKVHINAPSTERLSSRMKRRATGFVRPDDLRDILKVRALQEMEAQDWIPDDEEENTSRKVRIGSEQFEAKTSTFQNILRRDKGEGKSLRESVMVRLFNEVHIDEYEAPTLKTHRSASELPNKNIFLTTAPSLRTKSIEFSKERTKYVHHQSVNKQESVAHVLNIQHGKKLDRQFSSDYINTIDRIECNDDKSLRTLEFAKSRPTLTVSEYQLKNEKHKEKVEVSKLYGLRLPGDSPLYSDEDLK